MRTSKFFLVIALKRNGEWSIEELQFESNSHFIFFDNEIRKKFDNVDSYKILEEFELIED